jgi:hypothetical protein
VLGDVAGDVRVERDVLGGDVQLHADDHAVRVRLLVGGVQAGSVRGGHLQFSACADVLGDVAGDVRVERDVLGGDVQLLVDDDRVPGRHDVLVGRVRLDDASVVRRWGRGPRQLRPDVERELLCEPAGHRRDDGELLPEL